LPTTESLVFLFLARKNLTREELDGSNKLIRLQHYPTNHVLVESSAPTEW